MEDAESAPLVAEPTTRRFLEGAGLSSRMAGLVERFGSTAVLVGVGLLTPAVVLLGAGLLGPAWDPALGESAADGPLALGWHLPLLATPVPFVVGVWHHARGVSWPVRLVAGLSPLLVVLAAGPPLALWIRPDRLLQTVLVGLPSVVFFGLAGTPLLWTGDRRSYAKIGVGVLIILFALPLAYLMASAASPGATATVSILMVVYSILAMATFVGEGLSYDPPSFDRLRDRIDRVGDRADTAYAGGQIAAEMRETWRDRLDRVGEALDEVAGRAIPSLRLKRHGKIAASFAVVATVLAVFAAVAVGLTYGSTGRSVADSRTYALIGSYLAAHALTFAAIAGLAFASGSSLEDRLRRSRSRIRSRLDDLNDEVLEAMRDHHVGEEE